ncbi:MAG: protein kinase [Polyangiales bacterium]
MTIDETDEAAPSTPPALTGTTLAGRYRLQRLIGCGGMADVYEGLHTWTQRRVAVKVLRTRGEDDLDRVSTPTPATMERFLSEARAAAKTRHPHIVEVLDMGRDPASGVVFMAQEFLEGEDLRSLLRRRERLDAAEALALLRPVLDALVHAHAAGVIHRDVKPENIFLEARPEGPFPRLIDFGIARIHEDDSARAGVTRTGTIIGTVAYMSPEQASGQRDLDPRSDVWSIGVVLFEVLTGVQPFSGDNYNAILAQVLTRRAPRVRDLRPDVPRAVAAAIDLALEPDRERRPASMQALLDLLDRGDTLSPPPPLALPPPSRRWLLALGLGMLTASAAYALRATPPPSRAPRVALLTSPASLAPAPAEPSTPLTVVDASAAAPALAPDVTLALPHAPPAPVAVVDPQPAPHRVARAAAPVPVRRPAPPPRVAPPRIATPRNGAVLIPP